MKEAIVSLKDVGNTMFQDLGVTEISKSIMNSKSPYKSVIGCRFSPRRMVANAGAESSNTIRPLGGVFASKAQSDYIRGV